MATMALRRRFALLARAVAVCRVAWLAEHVAGLLGLCTETDLAKSCERQALVVDELEQFGEAGDSEAELVVIGLIEPSLGPFERRVELGDVELGPRGCSALRLPTDRYIHICRRPSL